MAVELPRRLRVLLVLPLVTQSYQLQTYLGQLLSTVDVDRQGICLSRHKMIQRSPALDAHEGPDDHVDVLKSSYSDDHDDENDDDDDNYNNEL